MATLIRSKKTNPSVTATAGKGGMFIALGVLSVILALSILFVNIIASIAVSISSSAGAHPIVYSILTYFTGLVMFLLFAAFLLLGVWLCIEGGKLIFLTNRYKKLQLQIDINSTQSIVQLAGSLARNPKDVLEDVAAMKRCNFWRALTILEDCIVIEPYGENRVYKIIAEKNNQFYETKTKDKFPFPVLLAIAFFIVAIIPLPLFNTYIWATIAVVACLLLYFLSGLLNKSRPTIGYSVAAQASPTVVNIEMSGNNDADTIIKQGQLYLKQLAQVQETTTNENIKGYIYDITASLRQLMGLLKDDPKKFKQVRQLMDYSMPTTLKLLQTYQDLNSQPIKGENITRSLNKIEDMSKMVADTFRKELDALYQDQTLNIEVDIEVMEKMIKQDSLELSSDLKDIFSEGVNNI